MNLRAAIQLIAPLAMFLTSATWGSECVTGASDSGPRVKMEAIAESLGAASLEEMTVCRRGDFAVVWNNRANDSQIEVLFHDQPLFWATSVDDTAATGAPTPLIAMVLEAGRPKVHLTDSDGDGSFDQLGYDVYDNEKHEIVTAIDENLDGQVDHKIISSEDGRYQLRVFIDDRWCDVESRNGERGVLVGSEFRRVERTPDGWRFTGR